jgi:SAM-dependent methyltransferase
LLTNDEVRTAWRLLLGREPESDRIYEVHRGHETLEALRGVIMQSAEFRQKAMGSAKAIDRLRFAAMPTSPAKATPEQMRQMFARIQEQWTALGESEPYWSVLTNPRFKMDRFEDNRTDFFQSGARNVDAVRAALLRCRVALPEDAICVELGCGVGRVSVQLAGLFAHVHGYDISPGNLALAEKNAKDFGAGNTTFHLLRGIADYDRLEPFDIFFSVIVLQHNPGPVQRHILQKLVERAKPGAVLYFQVPTYALRYRFDPDAYLASPAATLEMHVLPQDEIFDVLTEGGCRLLEVMEDNATGHPEWISNTFLAQKSAVAPGKPARRRR